MISDQKGAGKKDREKRRTKMKLGVVRLSAADHLGVLKVDPFVPVVEVGDTPYSNKKRRREEQ